jgi:DNA-binding transcriptional LysR family regulator
MKKPDHATLEAFIAVARERSFTRAAAKLNVSQSALSHAIRTLEEKMGLRLLARTTRSVATTDAGERLFNAIAPKFEQIEADVLSLGALSEKTAGTIRISCAEHAAKSVVWPMLVSFLKQNPAITVELVIDNSLVDIVSERFDAGIRYGDIVARDMIAMRVGPDLRSAVVGAPAYFKSHPIPKHPSDLTGHACINTRLPTHGAIYAWEFEKRGKEVKVRVDGPVVLNRYELRILAALEGLGLAYVPEDTVADLIGKGKLLRVLEDWCAPYAGYHLYYPSRRHPTPAFTALLGAFRKKAG